MTVTQHQIRPGAYYDSVVLMQLQKSLCALPGVIDAAVVMATPANCELVAASEFELGGIEARPDDLLILVKGESRTATTEAIGRVDELLRQRRESTTHGYRPRGLRGAVDALPNAEWVLISVPGRFAAGVADEALDRDRHVFLYSDNVSLEDELSLKRKARDRGLLVMGPDCGTAILNGVGLGFANRVRRGSVGIVAASGTGLQAVAVEIHRLGGGVSQAFGVGGRDLKAEVGGITALQALDWLARDEATAVIVLVSKPPSAEVAAALLRAAQSCGKPVIVDFLGYPPPARRVGNLAFAAGLTDAAELAVQSLNLPLSQSPNSTRPLRALTGHLRALFSGGTLAYEMWLGLRPVLAPLDSNLAAGAEQRPDDSRPGHVILDLGDDAFTQGRLHPMMDNDLRLRWMRREAADAAVDVILLDVVLGEGAHPDPASELAPAIAEATAAGKRVAAIVVGTDEDPQNTAGQIDQLAAAGAEVLTSVTAALDYVYNRLPPAPYDFPPVSFGSGLAAINVGLESFHDSVVAQGGSAIHVEWRPPAGGDERLMGILARMKKRGD